MLSLALAGLFAVATVYGPSEAHGHGCVASAVQTGACADMHADPLGFLTFHLQAVTQLGEALIVAAVAALVALVAFVLARFLGTAGTQPLPAAASYARNEPQQSPPLLVHIFARWLALLEKRDPLLTA